VGVGVGGSYPRAMNMMPVPASCPILTVFLPSSFQHLCVQREPCSSEKIQGYLAHKKHYRGTSPIRKLPPPQNHRRGLGTALL
jgi:hypothetical protein